MPTRFFIASDRLGSVGTTRYITITTAAAQLVQITSAKSAMQVFNLGSGNLIWGDSSIAVNSGNYIFVNGAREWTNVNTNFNVYFRADSVQTLISITEYVV